jgi:hypothetical protein
LCTRTVCALAHVFESHGLSTVSLSSVRSFTEKMKPPRALHCQFPLGRPLGVPGDAAYQRRVLDAAFDLLKADAGPILEDFPDEIDDAADRPLNVSVPEHGLGEDSPAVAEAKALRAAYEQHFDRYGHSNLGRVADADGIPELIRCFEAVADGTPYKEVGFPRKNPLEACKDLMVYFEEAAVALHGAIPEARQAESWFFKKTETGRLVKRAQAAMREAGVPFWFYLVPATQQG